MRHSKLFISLLLAFTVSCQIKSDCNEIKNGQYEGYGIVFYHLPVSGSAYELIVTPICYDTFEKVGNLKLFLEKSILLKGVGLTVGSREDALFKTIFESSEKVKLFNNEMLANEFKSIYMCPVYIEFKDANNITEYVTGKSQNIIQEKLVFEDGREKTLEYFLSDKVKISKITRLTYKTDLKK